MALRTFFAHLDGFHRHSLSNFEKRELYGRVFGVDLPAWIIFHAMLGYALLGVGFAAILLRLPITAVRKQRWLHSYLGYAWIFGTVWMPVTSIWCVYTFTGWDVVAFFIFSMFATIQIGYVFVRVFERQKLFNSIDSQISWKMKLWKWLHGIFMVYSFAMLLGAGISFPFRANSQYKTNPR